MINSTFNKSNDNDLITSCIEEIEDDSVHFTIRCLAAVPDELVNLLEEIEKQDMKEAGLE